MDVQAITWWDKLVSPLPFMVWLPLLLVAAGVLVYGILAMVDRHVFKRFDIPAELKNGNVAVAIVTAAVVLAVVWAIVTMGARAVYGATPAYDGLFRRWSVHYFGQAVDWREFKAQAMTESALRPKVCSHVGACGLMQIMPGTARELGVDPFRPREAIMGGVRYNRQLHNQWSAPRPPGERRAFMFASYNAGLGHVLRWQREAVRTLSCNANRWPCLLPLVWTEPRQYVERIYRWCVRFGGWSCYRPPPFEAGG